MSPATCHTLLTKTYDMEAVSEVSEDVTVAWKWLQDKWLLPLLPSLAGEAQNATKDADGLSKYQDCVSWPPQGQCQCLQALQVTIVSHHFTYSQQAKDSWWLLLEEQNMQRSLAHIPGWSCLVGSGSPASGPAVSVFSLSTPFYWRASYFNPS